MALPSDRWITVTISATARALSAAPLAALAATSIVALAPDSSAATVSTYRHGLYTQAHWSTAAGCATARSAALTSLARYGAKNVAAGMCHVINAGAGATRQTGYLFDIAYERTAAVWISDRRIGPAPAPQLAGAHSFKATGSYPAQAAAQTAESQTAASLTSMVSGAQVSWRSGVKLNAVTKTWDYEVDYTSRVPQSAGDVEISQKPSITSPSLGVVNPIPTNPTTDASKPDPAVITPPATITPPAAPAQPTTVAGIDISGHTAVEDWAGWKSAGAQFVYIKATEGNYYKNPKFSSQYLGANGAGIIRGAYHFANPSTSTGAQQADYFVANGGGWSPDGKTLPGALDMEWNPYGAMCFGMTTGQMRSWVNDYVTEYHTRTGVNPMIYTASPWWNKCVGTDATNSGAPVSSTTTPAPAVTDALLSANPLWVAEYTATLTDLPITWTGQGRAQAMWQNAALDDKGYDTNVFNGSRSQLMSYAATGRL